MSLAEQASHTVTHDIQFTHAPEGFDALALARLLRDGSPPEQPERWRSTTPHCSAGPEAATAGK